MAVEQMLRFLPDRIAHARKSAGLTKWDFCEMANIPRSTLDSWERGDRVPQLAMLLHICVTLDVPPNFLLGWEENRYV